MTKFRISFFLSCSLWLGFINRLSAQVDSVERYALVIGQNLPDRKTGGLALRYADDDAINIHLLLLDAGVESILVTRIDEPSRRLYPDLLAFGPPRKVDLLAAMQTIHQKMMSAQARGTSIEFLFFYSGHGDVDHGEGFIVLEDGRFSRSDFYNQILNQSLASKNHILIDACKSYFLAFEKGAGGKRSLYPSHFVNKQGAEQYKNTGFVLSTSSDRESHEWERYQSGVFSYQIQSALRGGADANGDGQVSYAEIGAFLQTANQGIANVRFRPDFIVRPPGSEPENLKDTLLVWKTTADRIVLNKKGWGHIYLEDAHGVRLSDVHPAEGEVLVWFAPQKRPLFVRDIQDDQEVVIEQPGSIELSALSERKAMVAAKGAAQLAFEKLFTEPFGKQAVLDFEAQYRLRGDPLDALELLASLPADPRSVIKTTAFWSAIGSATLGIAMNLWALERYNTGKNSSQAKREELNDTIDRLNTTSIVFYSIAGAAAATWLTAMLWPEEDSGDEALSVVPQIGIGYVGVDIRF